LNKNQIAEKEERIRKMIRLKVSNLKGGMIFAAVKPPTQEQLLIQN